MKEEKKKKSVQEEFIEELVGENALQKEKIEDDELFGKDVTFDEHEKAEEEKPEHGFDFVEHGRNINIPKEAVAAFAKAAGRTIGEVIDIYQKGCAFDELMKRYKESKADTEAFEKIANIRGIKKEDIRAEILGVLENAKLEKIICEIEEANPGMNRETAKELAQYRISAKKPQKKEKNQEEEKLRKKLRELDDFMANHLKEGVEELDNNVLEEWEKGVPLEKAFAGYLLFEENRKLMEEIENMKNTAAKEEQKNYAKEHSAGSVASASKKQKLDEFIEGLFKEY